MENRAYALVTGLFILLLGAGLAVGALWLGGGNEVTRPYLVVAEGSVTGLVENSNVLYRGVLVGQVESIRFNPEDFEEILVLIRIDADIPVTSGTYATLKLQGVTGFARVVLNDEDEGRNGQHLQTSVDDPARIPMQPSLIDQVTDSGTELIASSNQLLENLNALLGPESRARIEGILANAEAATAQLVALEKALLPVLKDVPELTDRASTTLLRTNELLERLGLVSAHVDELVRSAQKLGEVGTEAGAQLTGTILPRMADLLVSLDRTVENLQRLTVRLNERPEILLRGAAPAPPGPGEPGFEEPQ